MKQLIILLAVCCCFACSNDDITAAGVIAYAEQDGKRYLLLADHSGLQSHRGYGAFGGGLEENETLEQGALREFHEETACHFLGKIQAVSKAYVRIKHYVSFVVRIPFVASEQLNQTSDVDGCSGIAYSERENWLWVEQNQLLEHLKNGDQFVDDGVNLSLWDKSTIIIKLAHKQGLL